LLHIYSPREKNTSSNGSVEDSNCVTVPRRIIWLTKSIHITQLDNINDAPFFLFELNTWVYEVSSIDIYEVETSQLTQDDYNCPDHAVECPPGGDWKILGRMKEKMSLERWHLLWSWYSKILEEWKRTSPTGKEKSFEGWKNWIEKCHLGRNCHPCRLVSPQKSPKMPILILSSAQFFSFRLSSLFILMSINCKEIDAFFQNQPIPEFFYLSFSLGTCLCLTAHTVLVTKPCISC